jgi:16S rRNA (uracil1498-N3)-methyltransferase
LRYQPKTRLFTTEPLSEALELTLDKEQSHYLATVMRKRVDDEILIFNGQDGEFSATISDTNKRAVQLRIGTQTREQTNEPDVWIAFAPIKKARLDFIAQKATELGVSHMIPVMTRRTIVDRVKTDRMHANAIEAAEQCERLNIPTVGEPVKFETLMKDWPEDRMIMFCDEDLSGKDAYTALRDAAAEAPHHKWAIIIGPEGGFDDNERAAIKANPNTVTVSLGPRVLRADTAAMAAITLWQAAIGDWT